MLALGSDMSLLGGAIQRMREALEG
jgi:hypothetical protein